MTIEFTQHASSEMSVGVEDLRIQLRTLLPHPLLETHFPALGKKYEGKVRDNYSTIDGRRYVIATDRISAFDHVIGTLPGKGELLTQMARFWFEKTAHIAPNHLLSVPDPCVMECVECVPLPVEMVMRAYVTGVTSTSVWTHYARGERMFCGHKLPDGLRKNDPLPTPILTPSTKAAHGGHDVSASREEILQMTGMNPGVFDRAAEIAQKLFEAGVQHARSHGLMLVDTKYELGVTPKGEVVVIDEIHTPDSSRYWFSASYEGRHAAGQEPESFDKEYVRRALQAAGYVGEGPPPPLSDDLRVEASVLYAQAFAMITGHVFAPDLQDPLPRIARNLGLS